MTRCVPLLLALLCAAPWARADHTAALVAALADPERGEQAYTQLRALIREQRTPPSFAEELEQARGAHQGEAFARVHYIDLLRQIHAGLRVAEEPGGWTSWVESYVGAGERARPLDPQIVERLLTHLKDSSGSVRARGAMVLSAARTPEGVQPVFELLRDPDAMVRSSAISALGSYGELGRARLRAGWRAEVDPQHRAGLLIALVHAGDHGADALDELARALEELPRGLRDQAFLALGAAEEWAPLVRWVQAHPDDHFLLGHLRNVTDPGAVAAVLPLLAHEQSGVRFCALKVLTQRGDSIPEPTLLALGRDPDSAVCRELAMRALGQQHHGLTLLLEALPGELGHVAAEALLEWDPLPKAAQKALAATLPRLARKIEVVLPGQQVWLGDDHSPIDAKPPLEGDRLAEGHFALRERQGWTWHLAFFPRSMASALVGLDGEHSLHDLAGSNLPGHCRALLKLRQAKLLEWPAPGTKVDARPAPEKVFEALRTLAKDVESAPLAEPLLVTAWHYE